MEKIICNNINNKEINLNDSKDIELVSIIKNDPYIEMPMNNTFIVFQSKDLILYLIFSSNDKSICCFDFIHLKKIARINKCHQKNITNFRHLFDESKKRDIVMSISSADNNIKLWNIKNWECFLNLTNIYKNKDLLSACFMKYNNQVYIVSSNNCFDFGLQKDNSEKIKIIDFKENIIKEIDNSNQATSFLDIYYDNKFSKIYIIAVLCTSIKSYDFVQNQLYHEYNDFPIEGGGFCMSIAIKNDDNIVKIIEPCDHGFIKIWNFHSGDLLNKFYIGEISFNNICLWNDCYIFATCNDSSIKLINLTNGEITKNLSSHKNFVFSIQKFGEYLISQGWENDGIRIWHVKALNSN